jgi:hypothetical protein
VNRSAALRRRKALCPFGRGYATEEDARTSGAGQREGATIMRCPNRACGDWHVRNAPAQPQEPGSQAAAHRTRLRPVSRKRTAANRVRRAMIARLYPDRPLCAVPSCCQWADDIHEPLTRTRGGSITDEDNQLPLCRGHHDEITFRPESELGWAYELGLLVHSWERKSA